MASSYSEISFSRSRASGGYKPKKEIRFDESFGCFDDENGGLIINLEEFIKTALQNQEEIVITKYKSLD